MAVPRLAPLPVVLLVLASALSLPRLLQAQGAGLVSPTGAVDWNRFYTADQNNLILLELHRLHPDLTELYSIGTSFLGAPLMVMEVTNEATGPAADKPALYVDGGIHAGELTGSAVALHLLGELLAGYGSDPRITALLDARAFYVRPKFNPDGSDLALTADQALRSTVHPVDEDGDGVADEDPGEDLDGDGWITQMRVPDSEGGWFADPTDPRIMRRLAGGGGRGGGRGGAAALPADQLPPGTVRYRVLGEGIDNDGDGALNEDGIGGIDMNRNFPRNWEREHLQPGAGPFPLSEPETLATVRFITEHPNITGIVHGHTSGGFVYRLPSASDPTRFPPGDLELIEHLGAEYTRTTGRPVQPSSTHPTNHRYGTLISWGYWDGGIVGWVPEYVPGPEAWVIDYDGDGSISEEEELRFNDEELGGRYFSPWSRYDHPELGPVEIGGWHTRFWGQNPPAEFLEQETRAQLPWILYLAEQSPLLELDEPKVTAIGGDRWRVEVTVRNRGFTPTSLTGRGAVGSEGPDGSVSDRVVPSPHVTLATTTGVEIVEGPARIDLGHLGGTGPFLSAIGPRERTATWIVRSGGTESAIRVTAGSSKAGTVRSAWVPLGR
ncbi:MAG TPA: M14 family metallopeptidase [Longimicrobiales bacterium]|jgi:hypothetical protein